MDKAQESSNSEREREREIRHSITHFFGTALPLLLVIFEIYVLQQFAHGYSWKIEKFIVFGILSVKPFQQRIKNHVLFSCFTFAELISVIYNGFTPHCLHSDNFPNYSPIKFQTFTLTEDAKFSVL
jgi:hypothetical protein